MKKQKLLVIVGMPGSGKSEASKEAKRLGIPAVKFGEVVYDEVRRRKKPLTKENVIKIADWFHSSHTKLMVARLRKKIPNKPLVIIDGARDPKQVFELRKHYPVEILAITAPSRLRWKRELRRRRVEYYATVRTLRERDRRELGYGLGTLIKKSDYRIANAGTKQELRNKIRKLLLSLTKEK